MAAAAAAASSAYAAAGGRKAATGQQLSELSNTLYWHIPSMQKLRRLSHGSTSCIQTVTPAGTSAFVRIPMLLILNVSCCEPPATAAVKDQPEARPLTHVRVTLERHWLLTRSSTLLMPMLQHGLDSSQAVFRTERHTLRRCGAVVSACAITVLLRTARRYGVRLGSRPWHAQYGQPPRAGKPPWPGAAGGDGGEDKGGGRVTGGLRWLGRAFFGGAGLRTLPWGGALGSAGTFGTGGPGGSGGASLLPPAFFGAFACLGVGAGEGFAGGAWGSTSATGDGGSGAAGTACRDGKA